jgi:hypothetical protein
VKTQSLIHEFLQQKRFAMVGVSRTTADFSRRLFQEFVHRGYDVVPVNPFPSHVDGNQCFRKVQDIKPPVTSAFLMTPKDVIDRVLLDCSEAGISLVWIYGVSGPKDISPHAQSFCDVHGIGLVAGYCPFMVLPATGLFHRMHGWAAKMTGYYPK